jgi:hypothetical protein
MKSVKLKLKNDELVFHQQSIFQEGDEMVVFSEKEFLKFQLDMKNCIENALKVSNDSINNKSKNSPSTDALRIYNWIKLMENEIRKMDKTDIQKNLSSFK